MTTKHEQSATLEAKNWLSSLPRDTTLLPEIWQGHDNNGQGFKIALNRLSELGY